MNPRRLALVAALLLTFPWPAHADLTSGLVAYYPFTGNANDATGNGNHGIVNGPVLTTDRFGNPNSAYSFGMSDFIEVLTSPSLDIQGPVTLTAWTLTTAPQGCQTIFDKDTYRLKGWRGNPIGYALELYMPQQEIVATNLFPSVGVWTHVAGTWDGTTMSIYLDGVLINSTPATGAMPATGSSLFIGKQAFLPNPACWFFGTLDELRIYNRALTASEVRDLFQEHNPDCGLTLGYTAGTLTLNFTLGTKEAVQWNTWVSLQDTTVRLWSIPLPVTDPSVPLSVPIPGVPPIAAVGFLTTFTTAARGIRCSTWTTIDTGMALSGRTPADARKLFQPQRQ